MRPLIALVVALACAHPAGAVDLQLVAGGVPYLVDIQHAGDSRLFLVSQAGRILVWNGSTVLPTPFLDISSNVSFGGERGLLGLAFHPGYASNGFFYVHYTDPSGDTVVARYRVSSNPDIADSTSLSVVLTQGQPFANHNGGQLRFGPDGYLYLALGDGGSSGDPQNTGQRLDTLLGKILRIDVNSGLPYAIPATNPFVSTPGARAEIWSYGLRNPWRFSFDRLTGDMFIGDVGQGSWEEVNFEPAATPGRNYGWRLMEGTHCYPPGATCDPGSLTMPIVEYSHASGCSVTGGFRYRGGGSAFAGAYFYADYCGGTLWSATPNPDGTWTSVERLDTSFLISTFGEDVNGQFTLRRYGSNGGLYRIAGLASGFTDDPLVRGSTVVRAVHLVELQSRINALRTARGLAPSPWTDVPSSGITVIRAVHISELRAALDAVYSAAGRSSPMYTDSPLAAGVSVKAVHITELRSAVLEIE